MLYTASCGAATACLTDSRDAYEAQGKDDSHFMRAFTRKMPGVESTQTTKNFIGHVYVQPTDHQQIQSSYLVSWRTRSKNGWQTDLVSRSAAQPAPVLTRVASHCCAFSLTLAKEHMYYMVTIQGIRTHKTTSSLVVGLWEHRR